jgi:hypothetical protein
MKAAKAYPGPSRRDWTSAYRKIEAARQNSPNDRFYRPDESQRLQMAKQWIAQARGERWPA